MTSTSEDGTTLYSVTAPHFVAGLVTARGVVVDAAPILRWSIGKKTRELNLYLKKKKWKITEISCER